MRDVDDSTVAAFTAAADGVYTLDSSDLDIDQTVDAVARLIRTATGAEAVVTEP